MMTDGRKQIALNGAELGYYIHGAGPNKPPVLISPTLDPVDTLELI